MIPPLLRRAVALGLALVPALAGPCQEPAPATATPDARDAPDASEASGALADVDAAFAARLERLCADLEARMEGAHVPGMALAVVKDDAVVLARGFGLADVEHEVPVTPETVFAAGSTTKAFTATLVQMLVEEGRMDLDAPVTEYVPWLALPIDSADTSAAVTVRDLLCHRTGFTRMNGLLMSNEVTHEDILRAATTAEPWAPFRERFLYSNVMYLAAGVCAEAVTSEPWAALVRARLLEPLGMTTATLSVAAAQARPHLATGYDWDRDEQTFEAKPMRPLEIIAPAGALNASVLDMAQWVRFQLGRGAVGDRRLLSEERLAETWTPQTEVAPGIDYGLGWMLREWQGKRVVEHGGNIDGFTAQVALMPEEGLGFVLLFNVSGAELQASSLGLVWEALLGEAEPVAAGEVDRADYLGEYVADFATFDDELFTVLEQNGRLAVDIPSQMTFELKEPDAEGKWVFSLTDTIAVSFDRDAEGTVVAMELHQGGFTFEVPRKDAPLPAPEVPLAELERYLGTYRVQGETEEHDVAVVIERNRLAVAIQQMTLQLRPPDAQGRWVARVRDDLWISWEEDGRGDVVGFRLHEPDGEERVGRRVDETPATEVPTLEEVLALRRDAERGAALAALGGYRLTGTVAKPQSGVEGTVTVDAVDTTRMRQVLDFGKFGHVRVLVDGERGWMETSASPVDELGGRMLEQMRRNHVGQVVGAWRDYYDEMHVLRTDELDGRAVVVVQLGGRDLPPAVVQVDAETGDTLHERRRTILLGDVTMPVDIRYADWREVAGVRVPFAVTLEDDATGRTELRFTELASGLELAPARFRPAAGDEAGGAVPAPAGAPRSAPPGAPRDEAGAEQAFTPARPESLGMDPAALDALATVVRRSVEADEIVGAALLVLKDRRVVLHEAFGLRDAETGAPMERDTIHNVRSMTKPVTGTVAQTLIEEGRLGLDDRVADHLPAFDRDGMDAITVRHLLTHRGGLPLTTLDAGFRELGSLAEIAAGAAESELEHAPGTGFQYSDAGCETLGAVLEAVTGERLADLVRARVLAPLGMLDALPELPAADSGDPRLARVASLHAGAKGAWQRVWSPADGPFYPFAFGSQGLYCTPEGYARFLALWMDGGRLGERRLLSEATVSRALTAASTLDWPHVPEGSTLGYGELWMTTRAPGAPADSPPDAFGHSGSDGTWAFAWPALDLMVLLFTQSRGATSFQDFERAVDVLLVHPDAEAAAALFAEPEARSTTELEGLYWSPDAGTYRFVHATPGGDLRVAAPGLGLLDLEPGAEPDAWTVRQLGEPLRFLRAETGAVSGVEPPARTGEAPWTVWVDDPSLPDTAAVLRRHREGQGCAALERARGLVLEGTFRIAARGLEGPLRLAADGGDEYRRTLVLGGRELTTACDGERAWSDELSGRPAELTGVLGAQAREGGLGPLLGDWSRWFAEVRAVHVTDAFGAPARALHLVSADGRPQVRYVDVETGRAVAADSWPLSPGMGHLAATVRFTDDRELDGLTLPMRWTTTYRDLFEAEIRFETAESDVELAPDTFRMEPQ